jgi:three-Cys-motif partner protein
MSRGNAKTFFGRVRPWQWIKHSVFAQYLYVWAMKVGSVPQAKTIWVIDAFAGAGEFVDVLTGETAEGSPIKAAHIARDYNERADKKAAGKQMRLICIERDPDHHEALKERLAEFDFAEALLGEFSEHAHEITRKIGHDRALILLDPIGVKAMDAEACRKLFSRPGKTDALVNVQFSVVHRTRGQLLPDGEPNPAVPSAAKTVKALDAFFGTDEWRKRIAIDGKPTEEQEEEYLELYYDSVVGRSMRCKHHYPVSAIYDGKPKYYLVNIADHPDAEWLFNDLCAAVESRLYVVSCQRENPGALTGFFEDEDKRRIERLRAELAAAVLNLLADRPTHSMTFDAICLALRPRFFGKLKKGDYDKAIKQLLKNEKVSRQQKGIRPKLLPHEVISLPAAR